MQKDSSSGGTGDLHTLSQSGLCRRRQEDAIDLRDLAITVLYGMYLLARSGGASLHEVVYRQADGQIVTASLDTPISSAALFEAMRDQYGVST